jgi:tRNA A37 threonylcarbamoyltransferase TsaD
VVVIVTIMTMARVMMVGFCRFGVRRFLVAVGPMIVLGGGVACNGALQAGMRAAAGSATVFAPSPRLATDNAAMIAAVGAFRFRQGERASATFSAHASMPLPGMLEADQNVTAAR